MALDAAGRDWQYDAFDDTTKGKQLVAVVVVSVRWEVNQRMRG